MSPVSEEAVMCLVIITGVAAPVIQRPKSVVVRLARPMHSLKLGVPKAADPDSLGLSV